jgi:ribonuclease HI
MNTALVKGNTIGIFVAAKAQAGRGIWGAYLTTSRQASQQKQRLIGGRVNDYDRKNSHHMEVLAVYNALSALTASANVVILTDSKYLRRCITEWLPKWRSNGWKNTRGQPIEDADLWIHIVKLIDNAGHTVSFRFYTETAHPTLTHLHDKLNRADAQRQPA